MLHIPASKNAIILLISIGAIWPNSSVQSQMKLFAGKINPLPSSLSAPAFVRFGFGFIGIACVTQPSVSLSQRRSQSVLPRKAHTYRNMLGKTTSFSYCKGPKLLKWN